MTKNAIKNYFPLPNEIFNLDLETGEIAVYSYLLFCENRKNYTCYPSYKTIGKAIKMSSNTVRKYVAMLVEKELIKTEQTSVFTRDGLKRNGNLLYTISPISHAVELKNTRLLLKIERETKETKTAKKVENAEKKQKAG
ncbi:MAG: helix-turn-helix domain-containing protein [Clostridia bacterium]